MSNTYVAGSQVHITAQFLDATGALADPTTVTLKYAQQGKATVILSGGSLVHDSLGKYHYDLDTTGFGNSQVNYEWLGTGAVLAAIDGTFFTRQPAV